MGGKKSGVKVFVALKAEKSPLCVIQAAFLSATGRYSIAGTFGIRQVILDWHIGGEVL